MKRISIGALDASFRNIELDFGLKIASFEIKSDAASADIDPFQLQLDNPGQLRAVVTESAVADFLEAKAPGNISNFTVKIAKGEILVTATASIVISVPVKASCFLEIVDGSQVFVRIKSVDVMGGAAKGIVENQLAKINPILDVAELPISVQLTSVETENGEIILLGKVR
jgi:hypothetical protein